MASSAAPADPVPSAATSRRTSSRRTQAQRSASTQSRLLDATLECLIEQGYARTTTAQIEASAQVARGARLHHFATKALLVAAAVERLYQDIALRYAEAISKVAPDEDRFRAGLRLLWETYVDPTHAAVIELFVAARTDSELRATLRELGRRHQQLVRRRANEYFPDLAHHDADGLFETIQAAFTGLAVHRMVHGERVPDKQVLDLIERLVERAFGTSPAALHDVTETTA
jgi:AcrR family transcriptional regulator